MEIAVGSPRIRVWVLGLYLVSAVLTGVSVVAKADLVTNIVGISTAQATAILSVGLLLPVLYRHFVKIATYLAPVVIVGVWGVVLVLQPRVAGLHAQGRGTDQGDCVIVGVNQLAGGHWPYDVTRMWSGSPMSCGPDWLVMHAPLVLVAGYPIAMAALFTASAVVVAVIYGWRSTAVFLTLAGLSPGFWLAFANGNDFVTFGMCIVAVIALAQSTNRYARFVAAVLSVLVAHFRAPFLLLPAVALINRRSPRLRVVSTRTAVVASVVSVAIFGAFYIWEPRRMVSEGPLHILGKLTSMLDVDVNSGLLAGAFILVSTVFAVAFSRLPSPINVLFYCAALLIPFALLSLITILSSVSNPWHAVGLWEGVGWLTPVVCVSAFVLAIQLVQRDVPDTEPTDKGLDVGTNQ